MRFIAFFATALLLPHTSGADKIEADWHGSVMGKYVATDSDRNDIDYGAGARVALGRDLSARTRLELTAFGNALRRDERSGSDWQYGLGADFLAYLREDGATPYALAGAGGLYNDYSAGNRVGPWANIGAGIKFRDVWNRLSLRAEVRYFADWTDDAGRDSRYDEARFLLGFEVPLFASPEPQPRVTKITRPTKIIERERVREQIPELQVLEGVNFALDSAELDRNARNALRSTARELARHPDARIEIAGHTCNLGPQDYNRALSQRRAEAVRDYLIEQGIDRRRLDARGYGEDDPVARNDAESGREKNRRIELRRLDQDA